MLTTYDRIRRKPIHCQCEHTAHFLAVPVIHEPGARCTYVVRADDGKLICGICDKAGHGHMGRGA
jgi:hypothetical protein